MPKINVRSTAPDTRKSKRRRLNKAETSPAPKPQSTTVISSKPITVYSSSPTPTASEFSVKEEDDDDEYEDVEEEDEEEEVKVKKEKKDDDDDDEEGDEPTAPRSMCLRCSKHLRTDPVLRCTRPTATSKCRRCSSMNKKCDVVPELFIDTLHGVQRLGVSLHRKEIEKPVFAKAASKYVSNVEAYGRKSRIKPPARGAKAGAGAGAPEGNSVMDRLEKIEWRLEQLVRIGAVMAGIEVPSKEDGKTAFHAGEVDAD